MEIIGKRFVISGRVQRVYYRQSTIQEAKRLGVCGWVRNLPDGTVEAEAFGGVQALEQFEQWLHRGPEMAQVEQVTSSEITHRGDAHPQITDDFIQKSTPPA